MSAMSPLGAASELRLPSSVHPQHFGLAPGSRPMRGYLRRGRTPSWNGQFASHKALGPALFESLLDRDFQTLICADWRIHRYAVQAHELTYFTPAEHGGRAKRTYTPDIVAIDHQGQVIIIEVKAAWFAKQAAWTRREPYIREAYAFDHGARFLLFTEEQIRLQPRLANCELMLRHRPPPHDTEADLAIRDAVTAVGACVSIGEICGAAAGLSEERRFSALMRLALRGTVTLDLDRPLSRATRVTIWGRP